MCRVSIQRISAPSVVTLPEGMVANAAAVEDFKRPREEEHDDEEEHSSENMRSGKWTKEEEIYADALIEKFESGSLTDCPKGKTLRAYLSKKLNCIPMRVSKKYGGKCIGKHSYTPVCEIESAEETARMEELARVCWASIEYRIKHRRKRVKKERIVSDCSNSEAAESIPHSDNTDQEDMFLDDLLMGDFFSESAEQNALDFDILQSCENDPTVVDWSSLADDCLILL